MQKFRAGATREQIVPTSATMRARQQSTKLYQDTVQVVEWLSGIQRLQSTASLALSSCGLLRGFLGLQVSTRHTFDTFCWPGPPLRPRRGEGGFRIDSFNSPAGRPKRSKQLCFRQRLLVALQVCTDVLSDTAPRAAVAATALPQVARHCWLVSSFNTT